MSNLRWTIIALIPSQYRSRKEIQKQVRIFQLVILWEMETIKNVIRGSLVNTTFVAHRKIFMTKLETKATGVTTNEATVESLLLTSALEVERTTSTFANVPELHGEGISHKMFNSLLFKEKGFWLSEVEYIMQCFSDSSFSQGVGNIITMQSDIWSPLEMDLMVSRNTEEKFLL